MHVTQFYFLASPFTNVLAMAFVTTLLLSGELYSLLLMPSWLYSSLVILSISTALYFIFSAGQSTKENQYILQNSMASDPALLPAWWTGEHDGGCVLYNFILEEGGTGKIEHGGGRSYVLILDIKWSVPSNGKLHLQYIVPEGGQSKGETFSAVDERGNAYEAKSEKTLDFTIEGDRLVLSDTPIPEGAPAGALGGIKSFTK